MTASVIRLLCMLLLLSVPAGASETTTYSRLYTHNSLGPDFCTNITLEGSLLHIAKFKYWLNHIAKIHHGRSTLQAIINSGHTLVISHSSSARVSAGRTLAPMTDNLINGRGESVIILFDATVSERGSHMVFNGKRELIGYSAMTNLFHELAHARHKMNGTWLYFASERQAIEEENTFRRELAGINGSPVTERVWKTGVPIESTPGITEIRPRKYLVRSNPPLDYDFDGSSRLLKPGGGVR